MPCSRAVMDGNEAAALVAYRASEVIAIYPITPSSPMGEFADQWSAAGTPNLWGVVPRVQEMQSEGGAAGTVHGALQAGALTTTFTASQGLLLMIPNMYKIAGELTPAVFHIAARSLAASALSIFGDHSDVMAARSAGWAMLFASSVQECADMALVAHAATLEARVPFMHVFDGFRTSHELNTVERIPDETMRAMLPPDLVLAHRARGLTPERPSIRGTAQNPDVYFQGREAVNRYYDLTPGIVQRALDRLAALTGRSYRLFEYHGHPEATEVVVLMGSGADTVRATLDRLNAEGRRVGMVRVRLYRPFDVEAFLRALPGTVRTLGVLDRTKEPGAAGEPLFQDVVAAVHQGLDEGTLRDRPRIVGGRYGLSSKEFTPAMVRAVLDELAAPSPRRGFTVGIRDDVTHRSLDFDPSWVLEPGCSVRAVFWGLGSDGTVSANKSSVKILAEEAGQQAQAYFVYDSKKSGARTVSHLRFGPDPIHAPYLVQSANFLGVHQFDFLGRLPVLDGVEEGAVFLLNSPFGPDEVWEHLPGPVQEQILRLRPRMYVVDASTVAREAGMGNRINTVMQTCFFAISGVLAREEAIAHIKAMTQKSYGRLGEAVVRKNFEAIDASLAHLHPVPLEGRTVTGAPAAPPVPASAPRFVREVTAVMLAERGDDLPVSALPADGTWPSGTARWEKRNMATTVPVWEPDLCIQCGKCVLVCPHAVIRSKVVPEEALAAAPAGFASKDALWKELRGQKYTLQVSVEDCTGCTLCVEACPARDKSNVSRKALNMAPQRPLRQAGREHWDFFLGLPDHPQQDGLKRNQVKNVQLLQPLFEFSGACTGCGETPYLKLVSQLFGDRAVIANATGCSSIYGGNLPTTPWTVNREGRGPAWANSLFEDNAEFGLGMRLALDHQARYARRLLATVDSPEARELEAPSGREPEEVERLRDLVARVRGQMDAANGHRADLEAVLDSLVPRSVWIVGGDGWAYDIGYGGLDHVLASGADVNILVLDTEVYSNTGGQASKATPLGAVAKFATAGKPVAKKELGRIAMAYGNVYVAQVAMGASDSQTLKAILEAESFAGPSLVIAYSHCIAHGIDITRGLNQQKLAVDTGQWPLYRFDPRRRLEGQPPLQLDSAEPKVALQEYLKGEGRFQMLARYDRDLAQRYLHEAQANVKRRWVELAELAGKG